MTWEICLLSANDYDPLDLVREDIPDKYLYDEQEHHIFANALYNSEKTIFRLIHLLFQTTQLPREVYRDHNNYILDLTPLRATLIETNALEALYPGWLNDTGRENSMDEYGTLLDFIGNACKTKDRAHLLLRVSRREA